MGAFVGSSIYNAAGIYESGAGGGGGGGGGAGFVPFPEGYKRLLYFCNNKNSIYFRCEMSSLNLDSDCLFEFSFKSPKLNPNTSENFIIARAFSQDDFNLYVRDWTSYVGTTYWQNSYFFNNYFDGSTVESFSDSMINLKVSKDGIFYNDSLIKSLDGPFSDNLDNLAFPYQIGSEIVSEEFEVYSFKVKKGDNYIYDMLPALRENDNKVGWFDTVNEIFYPAIDSIAGPIFPY